MNKTKQNLFVKILKRLSILLIILIIALGSIIWYSSWSPSFLDDGPFHGIICAKIPNKKPDQIYKIYSDLSIETYDREDNDTAPIVLLRDKDNNILWAIYAIANDRETTKVESIRFKKHRQFPFSRPRIFAIVKWAYGEEASWWFIDKDGKLKEYWYSW